jgi:protein RecA
MAKAAKSAADIMSALVSVIGGNDEEATVSQFLDTGFPVLNHASGARWSAGLPVGRLIEIAGPPSSGKTAIATAAMAAAQEAGGVAGFMDHERSFSVTLAPKLGLDVTPGRFVYKKPKTFEESVAIFQLAVKTIREKKLIAPEAPICWVFDSLAAMVPQSILTDSKGKERSAEDRNMNDNTALARATSAHFPAISMIAEEYNVCVIFLNQLRTKIGVMFGDPRKTTGGDSAAYYFSQRLWLSASQIKKGTEVVGMEVTGKFIKNKVSRPFTEASWFFMFEPDGTGRFDREKSMIEFLSNEKILPAGSKAGSVEWNGKQYPKDTLAKAIRDTGTFEELVKLLPKEYEPPVIAHVETDEPDAESDAA